MIDSKERMVEKLICKIPEYQNDFLETLSRGERYFNFNYEEALNCVSWNYNKFGFNTPALIVAENPLEMQLVFNYVFHLLEKKELIEPYGEETKAIFGTLLRDLIDPVPKSWIHTLIDTHQSLHRAPDINTEFIGVLGERHFNSLIKVLFGELEKQMDPVMGARLANLMKEPLRHLLGDQLGEVIDEQVSRYLQLFPAPLNKFNPNYLSTVNFYSDCIYLWFEYLRKEIQQELSVNKEFQKGFFLQRNAGICQGIFTKDLCVVSKYPKRVSWNNNFNLHNNKHYAIEWSFGNQLTSMNGHFLDGELIDLMPYKRFNEIKASLKHKSNRA